MNFAERKTQLRRSLAAKAVFVKEEIHRNGFAEFAFMRCSYRAKFRMIGKKWVSMIPLGEMFQDQIDQMMTRFRDEAAYTLFDSLVRHRECNLAGPKGKLP